MEQHSSLYLQNVLSHEDRIIRLLWCRGRRRGRIELLGEHRCVDRGRCRRRAEGISIHQVVVTFFGRRCGSIRWSYAVLYEKNAFLLVGGVVICCGNKFPREGVFLADSAELLFPSSSADMFCFSRHSRFIEFILAKISHRVRPSYTCNPGRAAKTGRSAAAPS